MPRDPAAGYFWIRLAETRLSEMWVQEASRARETLATELTPAQTARAEEQARTWTPKPEARHLRTS